MSDKESCYYDSDPDWTPHHPPPQSALGFGKAFSSIMFAFAGASTFPTIQADMKERSKFPYSATIAIASKSGVLSQNLNRPHLLA